MIERFPDGGKEVPKLHKYKQRLETDTTIGMDLLPGVTKRQIRPAARFLSEERPLGSGTISYAENQTERKSGSSGWSGELPSSLSALREKEGKRSRSVFFLRHLPPPFWEMRPAPMSPGAVGGRRLSSSEAAAASRPPPAASRAAAAAASGGRESLLAERGGGGGKEWEGRLRYKSCICVLRGIN